MQADFKGPNGIVQYTTTKCLLGKTCCDTEGQSGRSSRQGHVVPKSNLYDRVLSDHSAPIDWQGAIVNFLELVCLTLSCVFSRDSTSNGQWLHKHCIGSKKGQAVGGLSNGMSLSAASSRQGVSNCAEELKAQVPFHWRLMNHIKWWEQH